MRQFRPAFSIAEVILAIAIFALVVTAITSLALGAIQASQKSYEQNQAAQLARQGAEAVTFLAQNSWPVYTGQKTALRQLAGVWSLGGEGTVETIGNFSRTVEFLDLCRNMAGGPLLPCSQAPVDSRVKEIVVHINWTGFNGQALSYSLPAYLYRP